MLRDAAKDAVKAALSIQKEAHDEAMQKLVDEQKKIHSPLSRTNLTRTSGISYNSMGGISSTPLGTITRPSITGGSTTVSPSGGPPASSAQDYFQAMSLSQTQVEKDLLQRKDDPVTEQGLRLRLRAFDTYNNLGGQKGLREVMGVKWLRILEFTQGASVPDDSRGDSELRAFLENIFISTNTRNLHLERGLSNITMPRKALTLEAMQLYAATFAEELDDQLPRIADPNDRVV